MEAFEMLRLGLFLVVLITLAVIDSKYGLLPNKIIYPAMVATVILNILSPVTNTGGTVITGICLGVFFLVIALVSKQLGAGDIKLALLIGLMTGFPGGIIALSTGIFLGGLAAIGLIVSRIKNRKDTVPYGPFLVAGTVFTLIGMEFHIFDFLYSLNA